MGWQTQRVSILQARCSLDPLLLFHVNYVSRSTQYWLKIILIPFKKVTTTNGYIISLRQPNLLNCLSAVHTLFWCSVDSKIPWCTNATLCTLHLKSEANWDARQHHVFWSLFVSTFNNKLLRREFDYKFISPPQGLEALNEPSINLIMNRGKTVIITRPEFIPHITLAPPHCKHRAQANFLNGQYRSPIYRLKPLLSGFSVYK